MIISILEIRVEKELHQKSKELIDNATVSDIESKKDYIRNVLSLLLTLSKDLKVREKYWLQEKVNKEDKTELDLIVKELSSCLKSFNNVDVSLDKHGLNLNPDIKFMYLKIACICKRASNLEASYNQHFKKNMSQIFR